MAADSNETANIDRIVAQRVAAQLKQQSGHTEEIRAALAEAQDKLVKQNSMLARLLSAPLTFGTLVRIKDSVNPNVFRSGDEVIVVDPQSSHYQRSGVIVGNNPIVSEEGKVSVKMTDDTTLTFSIGVEGKEPAQIRLTLKDDGTNAVVSIDGKPWEVRGVSGLDLEIGDTVKVAPDTKAVVGKAEPLKAGPICSVVAVWEKGVEVLHNGNLHLVYNPKKIALEEGDRVACDSTMFSLIERLPKSNSQSHKIQTDLTKTWDDIGGLEETKQDLRDALELPFQQPELFKYYGIEPMRGILLYGPPGCGKTLLARVAATSMAAIHGKEVLDSAYIYVKAPEILDKWVGNSEKTIRELFERGRRHYRENGYKAILVFDEADAIMPQRGSRRSSDVSDTLVPMFLGEMDGVNEKQTKENPIVFLLTNRADVLDPAVTRPGRISRHIKVQRPNMDTALDILSIHTRKIPFKEEKMRDSVLALAVSDLFSKSRLVYRINKEHDFTMGDCVSGAMIENLAEIAKMFALHRDLKSSKQTGIIGEDFQKAVQKIYDQQKGVNHSYDLEDFCEKIGIQSKNASFERCFGAA